jgi:hypothetical protein
MALGISKINQRARRWNMGLTSPASVDGNKIFMFGLNGEVLCLSTAGLAHENSRAFLHSPEYIIGPQSPFVCSDP